ncbi:hypothetical protein EVAR_67722_1 [Eumeta japonica]|uniref:Uncharacterized protein n=1 Tax=Eumeta variegata TaxID=151549 RepID=A0A4C1ZCZ3_EUMVA|nr:hypothetical protein EVAR_67722_1 [Eumeta japonica]
MLQNLENEEDYEVINTVQIEQLHDWMEVAAGPQNINQEDDLGRREIDIRYQWHSISSKQLLNSLETFIENEKIARNQRNPTINNHNYLSNFVFSGEQQEVINIFEKQLNYLQGYEEEQSIKEWLYREKLALEKAH